MIATAASTFMPAAADRTDLDPTEVLDLTRIAGARDECFAGLLIGFHHLLRGELESAAGPLRTALDLGRDLAETDLLTNMGIAAFHLGDDVAFSASFTRLLAQSRDTGALGLVLFALPRLALADLSAGQWANATSNATEALQLARSTGQHALTAMPLAELTLHAALRGEDSYADLLNDLDQIMDGRRTGILGELVYDTRRWAQGTHDLLAGQPTSALHHLEHMTQPPLIRLAAYDRLEAALRAGRPDLAADWLADLNRFATAVASPRANAVVAYGRALLADDRDRRGILRRGARAPVGRAAAVRNRAHPPCVRRIPATRTTTSRRPRPASRRAHHLRRTRRRPWAERARTELRASGESARKRDDTTATTLTAQERQVARHVAQGLSNRDVAAQAFPEPAHDRLPPAQRLRQDRNQLPRRTRAPRPRLTQSHRRTRRFRRFDQPDRSLASTRCSPSPGPRSTPLHPVTPAPSSPHGCR